MRNPPEENVAGGVSLPPEGLQLEPGPAHDPGNGADVGAETRADRAWIVPPGLSLIRLRYESAPSTEVRKAVERIQALAARNPGGARITCAWIVDAVVLRELGTGAWNIIPGSGYSTRDAVYHWLQLPAKGGFGVRVLSEHDYARAEKRGLVRPLDNALRELGAERYWQQPGLTPKSKSQRGLDKANKWPGADRMTVISFRPGVSKPAPAPQDTAAPAENPSDALVGGPSVQTDEVSAPVLPDAAEIQLAESSLPAEPKKGAMAIAREQADERRARLLEFLASGPRTYAELSELLQVSRETVRKYLAEFIGEGKVERVPDASPIRFRLRSG